MYTHTVNAQNFQVLFCLPVCLLTVCVALPFPAGSPVVVVSTAPPLLLGVHAGGPRGLSGYPPRILSTVHSTRRGHH